MTDLNLDMPMSDTLMPFTLPQQHSRLAVDDGRPSYNPGQCDTLELNIACSSGQLVATTGGHETWRRPR